MDVDYKPSPHIEAAEDILGKPAVPASVFYELPKELRNRAFTITGVTDLSVMKRVQGLLAGLATGGSWETLRTAIADQLTPDLGPEGALRRSKLLLEAQCFQSFQASNWRLAQADEDTVALQFLTTEDEKVCPWCSPLNGIIMPKNDDFWITNFPPKHLGCRCRTRSMNPDMVADEEAADKNRAPEHQLVPTGAMLRKLREGTIIRDALPDNREPGATGPRPLRQSQTYQINPPETKNGWAFNPNNLRIDLDAIKSTYGAAEFATFQTLAKNTDLGNGKALWDWLNGAPISAPPAIVAPAAAVKKELAFSGEAQSRMDLADAQQKIQAGFTIQSDAGAKVKFGQILNRHFARGTDTFRPRFLPAASMAAEHPVEVWQRDNRRYYIGRFKSTDGKHLGFIVIATRVGENADEVITFYPKDEKALDKFRKGELIYEKK